MKKNCVIACPFCGKVSHQCAGKTSAKIVCAKCGRTYLAILNNGCLIEMEYTGENIENAERLGKYAASLTKGKDDS